MDTRMIKMFKKTLLASSIVLALFGVVLFSQSMQAMNTDKDVLIGLHDNVNHESIDQLSGSVTNEFSYSNTVRASLNDHVIRTLSDHPGVDFIELNAPVDIVEEVPWGVERIFDSEDYPFDTFDTTMGEGINVGVIDTGIDGSHDDLTVQGGINTMDDTPYDEDANTHGTHVAGTIAAQKNNDGLIGVAPEVNLFSIKTLNDEGTGLTSDIIEGVEWAIDNDIDVLNMSLGSLTYSSSFDAILEEAYSQGMVLIGAAGNEGVDDDDGDNVTYPAAYDDVIAVSASTDGSGPFRSEDVAEFSSTGEEIELIAPGQQILSTVPGNGTEEKSGTSMAAPHVAGVAALVMAANPSLSNEQIRTIMHESAEDIGLSTNEQGQGLVRGDLAVAQAVDTAITHTIDASSTQGGSITPEGLIEVTEGEDQTFTFESDTGYELESIIIDGEPIDGEDDYTFENVTEDHTIEAVFTQIPYEITLEMHGGESYDPITLYYDDPVELPDDPSKEGHSFEGWYLDADYDEPFDYDTMPAYDLTVHAQWSINDYTIDFEHTGDTDLSPVSITYEDPIELTDDPSKEGHSFEGWYLDADYDEPFDYDTMPAYDLTLHARWTINDYTIKFENTGEKELSPVSITFREAIELPDEPSKEGHTFEGWYLDADDDEPFDYDTMPAYDLTVHAKWSANDYTIDFKNTKDSSLSPVSITYEESIELPDDPSKEGHSFKGWYLDADDDEPFDYDTMPAYDLTLHARWTINDYTINFENTGEKELSPVSITFRESIELPDEPSKEGHTFEGWYLSADYIEPFDYDEMPPNDLTLYARYDTKEYTLSLQGDTSSSSRTVNFGESLELGEPRAPLLHTFEGWYLDETHETPVDLSTMPSEDVNVYAKFSPLIPLAYLQTGLVITGGIVSILIIRKVFKII